MRFRIGALIFSAVLLMSAVDAFPGPYEESVIRGKDAYQSLCISCHGRTGVGDGPGKKVLGVPVGDLSDKAYMSLLSDQDLYNRIAYGESMFPYIQMPGWESQLGPGTIEDIVAYIRTLEVDKGPLKGPTPKEREERFRSDPLERGRVYYTRFCANCHGESGDGNGWFARTLGNRPVSFRDPALVEGLTTRSIVQYVEGKRAAKGKRYMPIFSRLDEEMAADIVQYIKTFPAR